MTFNASLNHTHRFLGEDWLTTQFNTQQIIISDLSAAKVIRANINSHISGLISNTITLLKCPTLKHMILTWVCVHKIIFKRTYPNAFLLLPWRPLFFQMLIEHILVTSTPHWSAELKLWSWLTVWPWLNCSQKPSYVDITDSLSGKGGYDTLYLILFINTTYLSLNYTIFNHAHARLAE